MSNLMRTAHKLGVAKSSVTAALAEAGDTVAEAQQEIESEVRRERLFLQNLKITLEANKAADIENLKGHLSFVVDTHQATIKHLQDIMAETERGHDEAIAPIKARLEEIQAEMAD